MSRDDCDCCDEYRVREIAAKDVEITRLRSDLRNATEMMNRYKTIAEEYERIKKTGKLYYIPDHSRCD